MKHRILIVEDVDSLRSVLQIVLEREGYVVTAISSAEEALRVIEAGAFDCIISDYKLGGMDGLSLLEKIRTIDARTPVLIMTAFGTIDLAVHAMKFGATDFLSKPFEPPAFIETVKQMITHKRIIDRDLGLSTKRERRIASRNPEMLTIIEQARRVAVADSPVLIFGESGTGKELLARHIHEHSNRKNELFVAINCAALPHHLLESEFFGHEAGSFTGAMKTRTGLFEYASSGTIFLDEIGDMPKPLQVKLLRALQEKEIKRVGGNKSISVNPRIIAATNCSERMVLETERLREDLYYRLAVITFELLPLRERKEDIHYLADKFCVSFSETFGRQIPTFSEAAKELLKNYDWPGNIRELENVIERAVILSSDVIEPHHFGLEGVAIEEEISTPSLHEVAEEAAKAAEKEIIARVLRKTEGNKSKAARELKVSYKTLLHKVKEYGLDSVNEAELSL